VAAWQARPTRAAAPSRKAEIGDQRRIAADDQLNETVPRRSLEMSIGPNNSSNLFKKAESA
jgi:hypothetical protein